MSRFDHTSEADLVAMTQAIGALPPGKLARLNAFVMAEGLMGCAWYNSLTVRLAALLKGHTIEEEWLWVFSLDKDLNRGSAMELIHHLARGKDTFDPKSAGGFSGPELARIEGYLDRLGYRFHMQEAA